MGYDTSFYGILLFTRELRSSEICMLEDLIEDDIDKTVEIDDIEFLSNIDLELTKNYSGIKWSRSEKTRNMVEAINYLIVAMRRKVPDFGLKGGMECKGQETCDVWRIIIGDDGFAEADESAVVSLEGTELMVDALEDAAMLACLHSDRLEDFELQVRNKIKKALDYQAENRRDS